MHLQISASVCNWGCFIGVPRDFVKKSSNWLLYASKAKYLLGGEKTFPVLKDIKKGDLFTNLL